MNSRWKQLEKAKITLAAIQRETPHPKNEGDLVQRIRKAKKRVERKSK